MLPTISTASKGLAVQSQRTEDVAQAVASAGATLPASGTQTAAETSPQVRIGALPVGVSVESMVALVEAQDAYQGNAAVIGTAADMLGALFDILDP